MKKNIIKVLALVLIAATVCTVFAACGSKLSGKYKDALGLTTLEFKGDKMKLTIVGLDDLAIECKYSIKGDEISITYDGDKADEMKDYLGDLTGTSDFEKGDDYIKIDGVKYKKAD